MTDEPVFIDRKCREIPQDTDTTKETNEFSLLELAHIPTFVLLGEPGMGKTKSLAALANHLQAQYITVQNFLLETPETLDPQTYYCIDALDEARVESGKQVFSEIRQLLHRANHHHAKPLRFGISCRIADWLSTATTDFKYIAPNLLVVELLPLALKQTHQLIKEQGIENPDGFITQAEDLGFEDMLGNPQSLKMLTLAVKQNNQQWPVSRSEAYSLASTTLVTETNERHTDNQEQIVSENTLLDIAGWLCSILLLSNQSNIQTSTAGFSSTDNGVQIKDVLDSSPFLPSDISLVLKRRVFQKISGTQHFTPIHRTVAEYLAARFMSLQVQQNNLPASRVNALILASPQHLISNLRGLAGWLAVLRPEIRQKIFIADPASILDYGDLYLLPPTEKQKLLAALSENTSFNFSRSRWRMEKRFIPLVQADMQSFVQQWLDNFPSRIEQLPHGVKRTALETTGNILFYALKHLSKTDGWENQLKHCIRNSSLQEYTRRNALTAIWQQSDNAPLVFKSLLDDIYAGKLRDESRGITGDIVYELYPEHLSPDFILKKLDPPARYTTNTYSMFWSQRLTEATPDSLLPTWMKSIEDAINTGRFSPEEDLFYKQELALGNIVARSIELFGNKLTPEILSKWLKWLGWSAFHHDSPFSLKTEDSEKLKLWLQSNQFTLKSVIAHRLRTIDYPHLADCFSGYNVQLEEMGRFWLKQSKQLLTETHIPDFVKRAQTALSNAFRWLENNPIDSGIGLADFEGIADQFPELKMTWEEIRACELEDNWHRENWLSKKESREKQLAFEKKRNQDLAKILSQTKAISSGEHLQFLHFAAWAEMPNSYHNNPEHNWILDQLNTYSELRAATHEGYVSCLNQLTTKDIQKAENARKNNQTLLIELPVQLGANYFFQQSPEKFLALSMEQLQALLTLYLRHSIWYLPPWFLCLAENKPTLVEAIWLDSMKRELKTTQDTIRLPFFRALDREPRLAHLAKSLLPEVLRSWPIHVSSGNLTSFSDLLIALIRHCPNELPSLLQLRLKKKSVSASQRAYLIMAGLWAAPQQFIELLPPVFTQRTTARNPYLGFIAYVYRYGRHDRDALPIPEWSSQIIGIVFKLIAPLCSPTHHDEVYTPTHFDDGYDFLWQLNNKLLESPDKQGIQTLQMLIKEPGLIAWKPDLERSLIQYSQALAEKGFTTPMPKQVAQVLQNRQAANNSDLMSITIEALQRLQEELDNSPTNLRHRFWTINSKLRRPVPPHRPEEECRNVIADWLVSYLKPQNISLLTETPHGDENRSDIALLARSFEQTEMLLPIEVKGDWNRSKGNRDVWHAAKYQLYDKYSTDPRCGGWGIYLVLWMGNRKKGVANHTDNVATPPNKTTIKTRDELHSALKKRSEDLLGEAAKRVEVIVLDLSID